MTTKDGKMKPMIKTEWLRRLSPGSGYKPAEGALKVSYQNEDRHCCLGVLGEMAVEAGVAPDMDHVMRDADFDEDGNLETEGSAYLTDEVCEWAGLPVVNRPDRVDDVNSLSYDASVSDAQTDLASANDSIFSYGEDLPEEYSPAVIDYINENL